MRGMQGLGEIRSVVLDIFGHYVIHLIKAIHIFY
jgi:hypothetical protein